MMMSPFRIIFFSIALFSCLVSVSSQLPQYSTANLSTSWIHNESDERWWYSTFGIHNKSAEWWWYSDPLRVAYILRGGSSSISDPNYACGFSCSGSCETYLFSVFAFANESSQIVWSANWNNPVRKHAALELTAEGDLVLRDADGSLAWSTDTAGKGVAGLNMTEMGNLVLFDANNSVVWQSFDHPTDCLLPGQILPSGKSLTSLGGMYSLLMSEQGGLEAYFQLSHPPQLYYYKELINAEASYAKYENGSLDLFVNGVENQGPDVFTASPQFMKLGDDGHLRVIEFGDGSFEKVGDIFDESLGECDYPMVCGKYGICSSSNGDCSCPSGTRFSKTSDERPDRGCSEVIPPACSAVKNHSFLDLDDVDYFSFTADLKHTTMKRCKEVCLKNCSCKAVVFRYGSESSTGDCYLPSQIFSLKRNSRESSRYKYNSYVSIKVETASPVTRPNGKSRLLEPILRSTLGVFCAALAIGTAVFAHECRRRRRKTRRVEDYGYPNHVPGMATRFSFEELATATDNFSKKLGKGGFGSVYEGALIDGTKVAVKHLDGVGHIDKSFIAEVETFGSIFHTNLVKLVGFCSDKSHKLLVYEYMCNGSLDRWIYSRSHEKCLGWSSRRKIILDIAKGLAYLHEECRQKIIHLDIKPQNILLDEDHNAKLADFGLSKLIDRNQIQVVTNMKGTPGYIAPEFLRAVITVKADVYSFGVVVLEIMCGRKVFEESKPEEERYLMTLFKKKAEEGQWLDLADKCCLDEEFDAAQVEEMMKISAWCIQSDHERRPCMSMVIKVLESAVDVDKDIDYNLLVPHYLISRSPNPRPGVRASTPLLPSVLSGPR